MNDPGLWEILGAIFGLSPDGWAVIFLIWFAVLLYACRTGKRPAESEEEQR